MNATIRPGCSFARAAVRLALAAALALSLASPALAQDINGEDNPAGVEGVFNGNVSTGNSYDPYTRCAMRDIVDLVVPGAVGERGLSFARHWRSRIDESGGVTVFGDGNWRHDYDWSASYYFDEEQPSRSFYEVYCPDGRVLRYHATGGAGNYQAAPFNRGLKDTLYVSGTTGLTLTLNGGAKVLFSSPGGTFDRGYRADSLVDRFGLSTTLSYNGQGLVSRITEPGGRYIDLTYLGVNLNGVVTTVIDHIQASNGQWVQYYYSPWGNNLPVLSVAQYRAETDVNGAYIFSSYLYQVLSTGGGAAFLSYAYDPHANGPMKIIGYAYDESTGVPGEIFAEANADAGTTPFDSNGNYRWVNVSIIQATAANTRLETRSGGITRTFTYGVGGLLSSLTDFEGHTTTYQRDANGYISQVQDGENRVTNLANNAFGRPTRITHAVDGTHRDLTYASGYYLLSATDELGHATTWTRDSSQRITRTDYADGAYEETTYWPIYNAVQTRRLTNGTTLTYYYDQPGHGGSGHGGLLTQFIGPDGATNYYYDAMDRVVSTVNPRGRVSYLAYNGRNQITQTTLPAVNGMNATTSRTYNNEGSVLTATDELGHVTSFAYDSYQRVLTRVDPVDSAQGITRTTQWRYDRDGEFPAPWRSNPAGDPVQIISAANKYTVIDYTPNRKVGARYTGTYTADQARVRWEYNAVGQMTRELQLLPGSTTERVNSQRHYDARGFMDWSQDAAGALTGQSTSVIYDAKGNRKVITLPSGRTVTYDIYDNRDRPTRVIDERNGVTLMSYYPSGSLMDLTDPNGKAYHYAYDASNRKTQRSYPDGSFEQWTYGGPGGNAGLLLAYRTRAGDQQNYTSYDERDRLLHSEWNGYAAPTIDYAWDAAGRMTCIANAASAITSAYNDVGELIQETQDIAGSGGARTIGYQRDAEGLVTRMAHPGTAFLASSSYTYNARNQLKAVGLADYGVDLASYAYRIDGLAERKYFYNGMQTGYTYDGAGRLEYQHTYDAARSNHSVAWRQYHYDAMSRVDWFKKGADGSFNPMENGHGDEFFYDAAGQLWGTYYDADAASLDGNPSTSPTGPYRGTNYYEYDLAGNRTASHSDLYTVDSANGTNRYTNIASFGTVTYDARGNLTGLGSSLSCTYDALGGLTYATSGGNAVSMAYDPLGRCVKRTVNGVTSYRYYSGWNLIGEHNNVVWTDIYFHGTRLDEMVAWWNSADGWRYFHHDRLGSVTHVTDNNGALLEQYAYDAFGKVYIYDGGGNPRAATAIGNRHLFTGREWIAELGIYDYRARAYHPGIGRFLQIDPIRFGGGDNNLYRYCGNDPINGSDPTGLQSMTGNMAFDAQQNANIVPQYYRDLGVLISGMPSGTYSAQTYVAGPPGGYVSAGYYFDAGKWSLLTIQGNPNALRESSGILMSAGPLIGLEASAGFKLSISAQPPNGTSVEIAGGYEGIGASVEFDLHGHFEGASLSVSTELIRMPFSASVALISSYSYSFADMDRAAAAAASAEIDRLVAASSISTADTDRIPSDGRIISITVTDVVMDTWFPGDFSLGNTVNGAGWLGVAPGSETVFPLGGGGGAAGGLPRMGSIPWNKQ